MYANVEPKKKKSHFISPPPVCRAPSFNISGAYENKWRLIWGAGRSQPALCKCQLGDPGLSYYHTKPTS